MQDVLEASANMPQAQLQGSDRSQVEVGKGKAVIQAARGEEEVEAAENAEALHACCAWHLLL